MTARSTRLFTDEVIFADAPTHSAAEATSSRRLSRDRCINPPLIATVTLPPSSPVELLTAHYSASARAYEQWWGIGDTRCRRPADRPAGASLRRTGPRPCAGVGTLLPAIRGAAPSA